MISNRACCTTRPDLIVMAVTSQLRSKLRMGDQGQSLADRWLLKSSVVKLVFATLEQGLVLLRLGALDDEDQAALRKATSEIIG